jgi:propanol-preferring alcohol dehydrogenase
MRSMRLSRYKLAEDSPLNLEEIPPAEPGPGEVRLQVQVCGVCHTDLHTVEGDIHPPALPITPGHQVVGFIDAVGAGVTAVRLGARVGVPWLYSADGECKYCQRGNENLCPRARFTGFHIDGGYAEYMLADADYVLPLPPEITNEQAAPLLCAGIIGYRSLRLADLEPGERIGLVGFGASAHLAIQVARYWGCEVYVFTRSAEHRRHASELGAAWVGGAEDEIPHPLDRAVIFAPAGALVPPILQKLRPAGTLAINAIHLSPIPEMNYQLIYGERTLRSVAYPLEDANQALVDIKHSRVNGEAVLRI